MAEFPPNLDDGELWLPSDIFRNEVPLPSTSKLNPHHHFPNSMDHFAQHFAALTLLKQRPTQSLPKPPLHTPIERFRPPVRFAQLDSLSHRHLSLSNGLQDGPTFYGPEFCHHCHLLKPAQLQVGSFELEPRARALNRREQKRHIPFQGSGNGLLGGFGRISGGTGVFHPLVLNTTTTTTTTTAAHEVQKKQGLRNRQEIKGIQQRNLIERVGLMGNGENYHHLHSDVGLPQDWSY